MSTITAPSPTRARRDAGPRVRARTRARSRLGRYTDPRGREREIIYRRGAGDSVLVIDRDSVTLGDRRLVAHLSSDEPAENARIVSEHYLADTDGRRCRRVTAEDLELVPYLADDSAYVNESQVDAESAESTHTGEVRDRHSRRYRLELVPTRMSIPEMRWRQYPPAGHAGPARVTSVREVIAALEDYEPVRALTQVVLARHEHDPNVSVSMLRGELDRMCASRIVLNRGLREAVLARAKAKGLSLSEIAMRCGRVKYDSRGNISGETSWLSRRLGLAPEGGKAHPTPWVHSATLALIVRDGLNAAPHEVEL